MNIRKIAFFITSAAILVSGMAAEASARTVDESGKTRISSIVSIEASLKSGTQSNGGDWLSTRSPILRALTKTSATRVFPV